MEQKIEDKIVALTKEGKTIREIEAMKIANHSDIVKVRQRNGLGKVQAKVTVFGVEIAQSENVSFKIESKLLLKVKKLAQAKNQSVEIFLNQILKKSLELL